MPVYDLLGGKSRDAVAVYMYANGSSLEDVIEKAQAHWENGFSYLRLQYDPMESFSMEWLPMTAGRGEPRADVIWIPENMPARPCILIKLKLIWLCTVPLGNNTV